jgi:hypothetical protein
MISEGRLNYWWTEIKREWDCEFFYKSLPKDTILQNVRNELLLYDESKYPGKEKHDQYIAGKKWKLRREGFLKYTRHYYDFVECQVCGLSESDYSDVVWNLHHNRYDSFAHQFFSTEIYDLTLMCQGCHESLHLSIDIALQGADRKMIKEYHRSNGKFFDENGVLKFGKYKGYSIEDVPDTYLQWIEDNTNSDYDLNLIENRW